MRRVAPGRPHTPDLEPRRRAQALAPGRWEGAGEGRRTGAVGTSLPQGRGLGSTRTPPPPPPKPRLQTQPPRGKLTPAGAAGSYPPGGCKPQTKVERGWNFPFNPFYTVKTAKLSPRRPLLIGRQTDEKPKQTCELTFFPDVFPSRQKASSLEGNRSEVTLLAWGLDWGAQAAASPIVGQPDCSYPRSLPCAAHGVGLHPRPASPWVTPRPHAPSRAVSLYLTGRRGR